MSIVRTPSREFADVLLQQRRKREGAKSGEVTISLMWNNTSDLDLHVTAPSGERICHSHKQSTCGGKLDVDMNVSTFSNEPVENVYWENAPSGRYQVMVRLHSYRQVPVGTSIAFRVVVTRNSQVTNYEGTIVGAGKEVIAMQFDHVARTTSGGGTSAVLSRRASSARPAPPAPVITSIIPPVSTPMFSFGSTTPVVPAPVVSAPVVPVASVHDPARKRLLSQVLGTLSDHQGRKRTPQWAHLTQLNATFTTGTKSSRVWLRSVLRYGVAQNCLQWKRGNSYSITGVGQMRLKQEDKEAAREERAMARRKAALQRKRQRNLQKAKARRAKLKARAKAKMLKLRQKRRAREIARKLKFKAKLKLMAAKKKEKLKARKAALKEKAKVKKVSLKKKKTSVKKSAPVKKVVPRKSSTPVRGSVKRVPSIAATGRAQVAAAAGAARRQAAVAKARAAPKKSAGKLPFGLERLSSMGFEDKRKNAAALARTKGNVARAVSLLV